METSGPQFGARAGARTEEQAGAQAPGRAQNLHPDGDSPSNEHGDQPGTPTSDPRSDEPGDQAGDRAGDHSGDRPSPRPSARRAETRRKLLDAAYEVLAEEGIRDARIEGICARAGFTRGAFYSNFTSKEELFLELYREQMAERCARLRAVIAQVTGAGELAACESLRATTVRISTLFMDPLVLDQRWYLLVSEFRVLALRQPSLRAQVAAAQRDFVDELGAILARLLDRLGITLRVSAQDAVTVLAAMYEKALEQALFDGAEASAENRLLTEALPEVVMSLTREPR